MDDTGPPDAGAERPSEGPAKPGSGPAGQSLIVLCVLALIAGIGAGFVGGAFRWCLHQADLLRTDVVQWTHTLGAAGFIVPVLITAAGATLAALIVTWVPLASGSGIQDVEAVNRGEAEAPPLRLLPAKFVGGLLAIGTGLVLGREGPTVHMGAVIGAETARRAKLSDADVRLMQTSLAGAGLAVAFNAPLGGALFVFEEVTKSFRPRIVLPTLLGVGVAVACSRLLNGDGPDFQVAEVPAPAIGLIPVFVVFGLLTGFGGALYNRLILSSLDVVGAIPRLPAPVKAGIIGAVVGLALFIDPLTAGGGDAMSQLLLGGGGLVLPVVAAYLVVRFVAGPLSYAAGTPGGLFAPLLAVGVIWGVLFAGLIRLLAPELGDDLVIPLAIVGMAALFGASVRAPFTGIALVIEMTAVTTVTVPMLIGTGCAVLATMLVKSPPIYDSLRERMLRSAPPAS